MPATAEIVSVVLRLAEDEECYSQLWRCRREEYSQAVWCVDQNCQNCSMLVEFILFVCLRTCFCFFPNPIHRKLRENGEPGTSFGGGFLHFRIDPSVSSVVNMWTCFGCFQFAIMRKYHCTIMALSLWVRIYKCSELLSFVTTTRREFKTWPIV